jgi:DNA-binding response OmpR family regulator
MGENLLRAENDELREKVRQLEQLLSYAAYSMPKEFGLTRTEEAVLGTLVTHCTTTRDHIMHNLYGGRGDAEPDIKIVDIYISRLRKKLKGFGIEIKTEWGRGYLLTPASKAIIKQFLIPEPIL